jgi:hypothetical protein
MVKSLDELGQCQQLHTEHDALFLCVVELDVETLLGKAGYTQSSSF